MKVILTEQQVREAAAAAGGYNNFTRVLTLARKFRRHGVQPIYEFDTAEGTIELKSGKILN